MGICKYYEIEIDGAEGENNLMVRYEVDDSKALPVKVYRWSDVKNDFREIFAHDYLIKIKPDELRQIQLKKEEVEVRHEEARELTEEEIEQAANFEKSQNAEYWSMVGAKDIARQWKGE